MIGKAERKYVWRPLKVIDISRHRQFKEKPKRRRKRRQRGSVLVRGNKLWLSFYYLGEKVREPTGLANTPQNIKLLRKRMDLIMAEIDNGLFEFSRWFPKSKRREHFAELEGRDVTVDQVKSPLRNMWKSGGRKCPQD